MLRVEFRNQFGLARPDQDVGAIAGHDSMDSTSADLPVPDYEKALSGDLPLPMGGGGGDDSDFSEDEE